MTRPPAAVLAMVALALAGPRAHAQPAGSLGEDFIHYVQAGDTLSELAEHYTGRVDNWPPLQSLNHVAEPTRMPVALALRIPLALIPEQPDTARIVHLQGEAQVDGQTARVGQEVAEGARLRTGAASFITLTLSDDSELTVPPGSEVAAERLRRFRNVPLIDSVFRIATGAIDTRVAPKGRGVGRFEVRTPVAVTGVRGTRFRVQSTPAGSASQVLEGRVRLQPHAPGEAAAGPLTVAAGYGAMVSGDGSVAPMRPLLPAPQLSDPERADGGWRVAFAPVPGAVHYTLSVSTDADALRVVSSRRVDRPQEARFTLPGAGIYYVTVHGVDAQGFGGQDATRPVRAGGVLMTSFGQPVGAGEGGQIMLTSY